MWFVVFHSFSCTKSNMFAYEIGSVTKQDIWGHHLVNWCLFQLFSDLCKSSNLIEKIIRILNNNVNTLYSSCTCECSVCKKNCKNNPVTISDCSINSLKDQRSEWKLIGFLHTNMKAFFSSIVVIYREGKTRRKREINGMLTYPCDSVPQIVCPMAEDAIPPNPFCSAPPHSEPPPPLLPLSSITPRYSCPCTFYFILLMNLFFLPAFWHNLWRNYQLSVA